MQKKSPKWAWFFFIIFQALVGTCAGLYALSNEKVDAYPQGTFVQAVDIGRLSYNAAKARLIDNYDLLVGQGKLTLTVNGNEYAIPYKDLDVKFDVEKTLADISEDLAKNALVRLISGDPKSKRYSPSVSFNTGKLTAALEKRFKGYEKDPVPDTYAIKDGQLIYTPRAAGIKIDYSAFENKIAPHILNLSKDPLPIDTGDGDIFKAFVEAQAGPKETFNTIISHSTVSLGAAGRDEAIKIIESLNGNIFNKGASIKLSAMVDLSGDLNDGRHDLINRTATAMYQAFLPIQGIKVVNRRQSEIALPYAEAGLEAVIEGENADLELINGTDRSLLLLGEVRNGSIHLYVVSGGEIPSGVLITQKKDIVPPPVIYNVNGNLEKGETKVISEGSEGFTVDVSRVIGNDREELYTDHYEPVGKVVEVSGELLYTGSK